MNSGVAADTVRRCASARALAERLVMAGLASDLGQLSGLPLKTMGVLERLSRYGDNELVPVLKRVLGPEKLKGPGLVTVEREVRARAAPLVDRNSHALRLRSQSFREAALVTLDREAIAAGHQFVRIRSREPFDPFIIDAAIVAPKGSKRTGVRLLPETGGASVRWRVAEAFVGAIAATRAFDAVLLVVEAAADAEHIAQRLERIGACGVGLTRFDLTGALLEKRAPQRSSAPDLASSYAAAFNGLSLPVAGS